MKYNLSNIATWPHFDKLVNLAESATKALAVYYKKNNFTFAEPGQIRIASIGGRYIKLATFEDRKRAGNWEASSVYCFVDLENGNILKGSWKAPVANGVRGNLNDADILKKVTTYGVGYLRGGDVGTVDWYLKNA